MFEFSLMPTLYAFICATFIMIAFQLRRRHGLVNKFMLNYVAHIYICHSKELITEGSALNYIDNMRPVWFCVMMFWYPREKCFFDEEMYLESCDYIEALYIEAIEKAEQNNTVQA